MKMELFWFIPTHGDARYLGVSEGTRPVNFRYCRQVAEAAESLGFAGVLIPTGKSCEDPWIVASSLISSTTRLKFLVALRPGVQLPTHAARMAATLDRFSGGRLLLNVVAGGDPEELAGDGLFLSHDERYELTDEFLKIWRQELSGQEVDFAGRHFTIKGGGILYPPAQKPHPPLFFSGSSEAGMQVAAEHAEVYLTWGEHPAQVEEKISRVRQLAEARGRQVRFGIRFHVIVRETEEEAWKAAEELIARVDDQAIAAAQRAFARMDSVGQKRMSDLHQGSRANLVVSPNLWAGIGLIRGGAGTALVGDPDQVAERIREYARMGIELFVLSGYPHLEEAYRTAELLFPKLGVAPPSSLDDRAFVGPFAEKLDNNRITEVKV